MKVVDHFLDCLSPRSRRGREREDSEVWVPTHHVPDDSAVRIVTTRAVCLVDDDERHVPRVEPALCEVAFDGLRRRINDSLRCPTEGSQLGNRPSRQLDAVFLWDPRDVVTRLDLLRHERPSRCEEDDFSARVPAIKVEPVRQRVSTGPNKSRLFRDNSRGEACDSELT